jgi:hypothetical protein
MALVIEVEATVGEAESGHVSREVTLPNELVDIVQQGAEIDWHAEGVSVSSVSRPNHRFWHVG